MFALFGHQAPLMHRLPDDLRATLRWQAGRRRFALHQVWANGRPYRDCTGGAVLAALAAAPTTAFFADQNDPVLCRVCRHGEAADQDVPAFVFPSAMGERATLVGRVHPPQPPCCALCGGVMEPTALTAHQILARRAR
jgi:hypothetical protein